jgi:hypothetical protein
VAALGLLILLVRMEYAVNPGDNILKTLRRHLPRWSTGGSEKAMASYVNSGQRWTRTEEIWTDSMLNFRRMQAPPVHLVLHHTLIIDICTPRPVIS